MSAPQAIPLNERVLANGLRLITVVDRTAPTATVNIWYHVGSKDERAGRTGFAHLFEHLMFQGSANVSKAEHLSLIESVGGSANATTWLDRTNYFATVPAEWVELVLWMEADRLGTLLDALDQANLDNQRDVVKNEKRSSYDNQPYGTAYLELLALAYPNGHPYHHPTIGSMEDLTRPACRMCATSSPHGTRRTTPCSRWSAISTKCRSWRLSSDTSAAFPHTLISLHTRT